MAENTPTKGAADQANELKELVVGYAKQETVDPLKVLGQKLGWGAAGSVLVALGSFFLVLATLRGLQQIDVFNRTGDPLGGWFSWVPYIVAMLVGAIVIGLCARAIMGSVSQPANDASQR